MSFCGHADFVRAKPEKTSGAPVRRLPAQRNSYVLRFAESTKGCTDSFQLMAEGMKIRKELFAPEIERINAKDPATAALVLAVCEASINFLKHEEIAAMFFREGMKLSAVVALGTGSNSVMVNTHVELRDENSSKAWEYKRQLEGYRAQIKQIMRKPEYKGNELLGYLLLVIDKQPMFIGKPPEAKA